MAEFKLGRIRFVWKDAWVTGTTYYKDDVVRFGGRIYICIEGHVAAADFFTDLDQAPSKWNLVSDGQTWKGDWSNTTAYIYNDIVKYGARLYIANTVHTSATSSATETYNVTVRDDPSVSNGVFLIDGVVHPDIQMIRGNTYIWNQDDASNLFTGAGVARHPMVISTTQDGTHNGGTIYTDGVTYFLDGVEVADAAAYDAGFAAATTRQMRITIPQDAPDTLYYFCYQHAGMSGTTASAEIVSIGLEDDSEKWDIFADGLDWKGEWHEDFVYRINDLVKYGGTTYVCNSTHTSTAIGSGNGLEVDQLKWDYFNQGFDYKSTWAASTRYKVNDVVQYGAGLWIATAAHTSSSAFSTDSANWDFLVRGFQFESEWDYTADYQQGDVVRYGGNQYIALQDNSNSNPFSNPSDWNLFSEGLRFLGEWGDDSSGIEYKVGEVVRHGGYTYLCIEDHANQQPPNATYWQQLNSGLDWRGEWLDDQEYFLGDVVRYGSNTYVCVLGHVSEGDDYSSNSPSGSVIRGVGSRPDQDDSGLYWNVLAIGSEASVLTTKGDMVYYSGSGPARLPIGANGQFLTVSGDGIPEWAYRGVADDVYYVAEHGVDSPAPDYGRTLDRPWKSIRYACQQAERGTKVPQAAKLLELNRRFIQREIVEWTDYQITNNTSPFTSSFQYDTVKCERDMGLIIDALIWDIQHGGNVRSREAALAYVNDTVGSPYLQQKAETVASINYGLTIIANILAQTDPDTNYQIINGDNSTAIVSQYKDEALVTESGVLTDITSLVGIITDAITAGVADNIPERIINNILIKVSTGVYTEVLPIIVPAETCVIGDELRSTKVRPRTVYNSASTLTPKRDVKFSFKGLERIETILPDIVTGSSVVATTGNTETQSTLFPYGEEKEAGVADTLSRVLKRQIDHGVGTKIEAILPREDQVSDANFVYGRDLVLENKEFIQEEIIAFIADTNPDLKYSRTKCKQDVGYILDAVAYDLSFGGNWQSVNAGEAYYQGSNLQIDSSEKTATLAAYNYLRTLLGNITRDIEVNPPYQTTIDQVRGEGGTNAVRDAAVALIDDIRNIINNGSGTVSITYPSTTGIPTHLTQPSTDILTDYATIKSNVTTWIDANFPNLTYDSAKCQRDVGYLLDAARYDAMLETNYASIVAAYSYLRAPSAKVVGDQKDATIAAYTYIVNEVLPSYLTTYPQARPAYDRTFELANDLIFGGSNEASNTQNANQNVYAATRLLELNKDFVTQEVLNYVNYWFKNSVSKTDSATNEITISDTSWLEPNMAITFTNLDDSANSVVESGLQPGSTYYVRQIKSPTTFTIATSIGGAEESLTEDTQSAGFYDKDKCRRDTGYIIEAVSYDITLGTNYNAVLNGLSYQRANASEVTGNQLEQTLAGITAARDEARKLRSVKNNATALARSDAAFAEILDIVENGAGNADALTFPAGPTSTTDQQNAVAQLIANRTFLQKEVTQYIADNYPALVYDSAKCERDVGYLVDALCHDIMYGGNWASVRAAEAYFVGAASQLGAGQATATAAAYDYLASAAGFVVVETTSDVGTGFPLQVVVTQDTSGTAASATEQTQVADLLQITEDVITAGNLNGLPDITYPTQIDTDLAPAQIEMYEKKEDIIRTVIRTVDDQYSAIFNVEAAYNYNVDLCSRDVGEYVDAMKWDMTWPANYSRTYSSVASVNVTLPGMYRTKLAARYYINSVLGSQEEDMYYLRNGTGLRLQTLDGLRGDLGPENSYGTSRVTAGAYASLDPGWGPDDESVWITARSPYVQNLTTFGYAATGQKIDGALHNGGNDSIVSNDFTQVISDGIGAHILNNGRAELVSVFTYYSYIGYLAETGGRVRATNGNNSYGTFGSVAEGVDPDETPVTAIVDNRKQYNATISAVETDNSQILTVEYSHAGNEYTEAAINFFGAGANEETVMDEFRDNGVFEARLLDLNDSSGDIGGSGYQVQSNTAQAGTTTSISLAATDGSTSTAYPGMKVVITGGAGVGQYGIIDSYDSGTKVANVVRDSDGVAGWDHFVPGTAIVAPNSSSTYLIEPRVLFADPPQSNSNITLPTSDNWNDVEYFVTGAQYLATAATGGDGSGATFNVSRVGSHYYVTLDSGGTGYTRLNTLTIDGTNLGGVTSTNDLTITATTVNATTGAIEQFDIEGFGLSGRFIAIGDTVSGAYSTDNSTWSTVTLPTPGGGTWGAISTGLIDDGSSDYKPSAAVIVANGSANAAYSADGDTWNAVSLPAAIATAGTKDVAFGRTSGINRFVVISSSDVDVAYSDDGGATWNVAASALPGTGYSLLTYGAGKWVAIEPNSTNAVFSTDGITWTPMSSLPNKAYNDLTFGQNRFIAVADGATGQAAYSLDGLNWTALDLPDNGSGGSVTYNNIGYGQGVFVATQATVANTVMWSDDGIYWRNYSVSGTPTGVVAFGNPQKTGSFAGISASAGTNAASQIKLGARAKGRPSVASEKIFEIRLQEPGSNYDPLNPPTITVTDPQNIYDAIFSVRVGDGVLAQPTFVNRGTGFIDASAELADDESNGFADFFQSGNFIAVRRLSSRPTNGSNIEFGTLPGQFFKLVNTVSFIGSADGSYTAFLQISPDMPVEDAPSDADSVEIRIRYSQVRLTGHDFLDIGTGNFVDTNYPGIPVNDPVQANETVEADGGRVFFTATDQDGNFRVGDLFSIEQATGVATLNAEAFNIAGLQELTLGEVTLGGNSASVEEFSTDPFFTANSDSVVPTQRAVKAYIEAQIGGGGASLNVNTVTAGDIFIGGNSITTVSGEAININAKLNFIGPVVGIPLAFNYMLR